jgi:hypothetical protein
VQSVGVENSPAGKMSPLNVWTTTIGDELKMATNFKSKVFGVSLKDRGAIIPAGHAANGAYWYDGKSGTFISSTYYTKALPTWLTQYNNTHKVDSLYKKGWNLSLAKNVYAENCDVDVNEYEATPFGKEAKGFPYSLDAFIGKDYSRISSTPMGNNLVLDVAEQTLFNEKLGQDSITDLLAVSFSAPDYIGHAFGPNSWETMDGYIKLDEVLAQFFAYLDKQVGKNNYTVFLTADHAVANIPAFLAAFKATVATGTPLGICKIDKIESHPSMELEDLIGTPITGKLVIAAIIPGKCAAPPAPAMIIFNPLSLAV